MPTDAVALPATRMFAHPKVRKTVTAPHPISTNHSPPRWCVRPDWRKTQNTDFTTSGLLRPLQPQQIAWRYVRMVICVVGG